MTSRATRLVVNADDLGLAVSVNRGILETMQRGVVTSASLMVNTAAVDDAVRRLREAGAGTRLDVGIGLHFNIVAGSPLTRARTLTRDGTFASPQSLAWRAVTGRLDAGDVEAELRAQLERARSLLAQAGLPVTHIDSHRHVHALPPVYRVVTRVAGQQGIRHVRHPIEGAGTTLGRPRAWLASRALRVIAWRTLATDDVAFAGFALMGSRDLERDLGRLLDRVPRAGAVELMVHPGYDSPELAVLDPYRAPREREVRALTSPALRDRLAALGMELTHFGATAPPA